MGTIRREVVPFMADAKDALSLCKRKKDDFYLNAFKIECWLGALATATAAQYGEQGLPNRRKLQVGEAGRIFDEVFRDTSDRDFSVLFSHLTRFAQRRRPYNHALRQGYGAMSKENDYRAPRQLPQDRDIGKRSRLQRKFVERLCEWLDAIAHWESTSARTCRRSVSMSMRISEN